MVFFGLSILLYSLLVVAMLQRGYSLSGKTLADFSSLLLLGAAVLLQGGLYYMVVKNKVYWLAIGIAVICWLGLYKAGINLHKLPPEVAATHWDGLGEQLFPKDRR